MRRRLHYLRRILVPDEIKVTVNDEELRHRCPVHAFEADLETEMADADGILPEDFARRGSNFSIPCRAKTRVCSSWGCQWRRRKAVATSMSVRKSRSR